MPHGSALSRRSVLAGGVALLGGALVSCTIGDEPEPDPSGSPNPDAAALRAALAREDELLAAYAALDAEATAANPGLAEVAARHELHRTAVLSALAAVGAAAAATPADAAPPLAAVEPADLAALEAIAAAAGRSAANQVAAADLAGLLAAIAAAENANSVELSQ